MIDLPDFRVVLTAFVAIGCTPSMAVDDEALVTNILCRFDGSLR